MKYTIHGFSQQEAVKFKKTVFDKNNKEKDIKIDCTDLLILRWFVDFYPKMMKVEIDGVQYAWLQYQKILQDLPLLDIKKQALFDRLQKLCEFKILNHKTVKVNGTFSYYGFGEMYGALIDTECSQIQEGEYSTNEGVCSQPIKGEYSTNEQINNSIKDTSFKNNNFDKDNMGETQKRKRFVPPTREEVQSYCLERKNNVDAERFIDYYTANGWYVGKNKMKDWKAAVRTWEKNNYNSAQKNTANKNDGWCFTPNEDSLDDLF